MARVIAKVPFTPGHECVAEVIPNHHEFILFRNKLTCAQRLLLLVQTVRLSIQKESEFAVRTIFTVVTAISVNMVTTE